MDLKYTRPDDTGTYTCRAYNQLGEANLSAQLNVVTSKDGPNAETLHEDALQKIAYLEHHKQQVHRGLEEEMVSSAPNFVVQLQGKNSFNLGKDNFINLPILYMHT